MESRKRNLESRKRARKSRKRELESNEASGIYEFRPRMQGEEIRNLGREI